MIRLATRPRETWVILSRHLREAKPLRYGDRETRETISIIKLSKAKIGVNTGTIGEQVSPDTVSCKGFPHTYAQKPWGDYKLQVSLKSPLWMNKPLLASYRQLRGGWHEDIAIGAADRAIG